MRWTRRNFITVLRYFFGFRVFSIDKGEMFNQACRGCFLFLFKDFFSRSRFSLIHD